MPGPTVDRDHLSAHGYVVVEQVVESPYVTALLDVVRDVSGVDLEDPATWDFKNFSPPIWGHQAQWDVRQRPAVHAVFADLHGDEALIVSQDGIGIKPPLAVAPGRSAAALPLHWDRDPRDAQIAYQGVLYLTDVTPDRGAFCGVPGLFADLEGWLGRHPGAGLEDVDLEDHEIVPVAGRAGDLVVFDSRLPHGNGPNHARLPRVVQYLTMSPPALLGGAVAAQAELYRSGRAQEWLRGRPGWDVVQPWPPAELTPLGRRLAGLDPWD